MEVSRFFTSGFASVARLTKVLPIFKLLQSLPESCFALLTIQLVGAMEIRETAMRKLLALAVIALGLMASGAWADPISDDGTGVNSCLDDSCYGSVITLQYTWVSDTEFDIQLIIDTTDFNLGDTYYIAQVAFKPVSSTSDIASATLTAAPGSVADWTPLIIGGLANGGCTVGTEGFICATDSTTAPADGSTWEWDFTVTVGAASDWLLADNGTTGSASVKVNYDSPDHLNGSITSSGITLQTCCQGDVPEPQSLALVGLGLFGLALLRRKRNV
jgi:hypothetical protein